MTEHSIQAEILRTIGARPDVRIWRNNTGVTKIGDRWIAFGLKGSADILGIIRGGRFLAIEVKSAGGKQTIQQQRFQRMIERFGGVYILARSAHDVEAALPPQGAH